MQRSGIAPFRVTRRSGRSAARGGTGRCDFIAPYGLKGMSMGNYSHIIEMFWNSGDQVVAIREAARYGELVWLRRLIAEGVAVDSVLDDGVTPLMLAACSGKISCAKFLIENGANVNAISHKNHATPLLSLMGWPHRCSTYVAMAKLLLSAGADIHIRESDGLSALDWAEERGCEDVVELLKRAHGGQPGI